MKEKIKQFFEELMRGYYNFSLHKELMYEGRAVLEYAIENNKIKKFKKLITPQQYADGYVRIIFDPFSDIIFSHLNYCLDQGIAGIKEIMDDIYIIDYEMLSKIKIKDSHARQISGMGHPINGIKDIILFSEPACLQAMIKLYELNIDTWGNDTEGVFEDGQFIAEDGLTCGINIYYSRLSDENKKIIDKLREEGVLKDAINNEEIILIYTKCDREETIGDVSKRLFDIVSQLKIQDVKYYDYCESVMKNLVFKIYSFLNCYDFLPRQEKEIKCKELMDEIDKKSLEELSEILCQQGYYISYEENKIFCSKNVYLKHLKYLKSQDSQNNLSEDSTNVGEMKQKNSR